MAAQNFSVKQDEQGIYHFEGEVSIHALDYLKDFLEKSFKGGQDISISLAKVRFVDTAALQLLIAFKKRFEPEIKLKISDISSEVEHILSLCGLKTILV